MVDGRSGRLTRSPITELLMINNPLAREALKKAASTVNSGVRQGVSSLIEQETATLRNRVSYLERELAEMKDRVERLERDAGRR